MRSTIATENKRRKQYKRRVNNARWKICSARLKVENCPAAMDTRLRHKCYFHIGVSTLAGDHCLFAVFMHLALKFKWWKKNIFDYSIYYTLVTIIIIIKWNKSSIITTRTHRTIAPNVLIKIHCCTQQKKQYDDDDYEAKTIKCEKKDYLFIKKREAAPIDEIACVLARERTQKGNEKFIRDSMAHIKITKTINHPRAFFR